MEQVNEKSTAYLTVAFTDKDGVPAAPASATYRIDDATGAGAIRASTALGAGASVEITLTKEDNAIVNAANRFETRVVTVIAVYGASDELRDEYRYQVKNLDYAS